MCDYFINFEHLYVVRLACVKSTYRRLGCDWLEMDVVITADNEVLVSHEPWMSHVICRTANGDSITQAEERSYNIYKT